MKLSRFHVRTNGSILALTALLLAPFGICAADTIYVAEEQLLRVSLVQPGSIHPFANGVGLVYGLESDGKGNLYAADAGGDHIYKINSLGAVSTFASGSVMGSPSALAFDNAGNLYTSGQGWGGTITRINPDGIITPFVSGVGGFGLAFDASGNLFASRSGSIVKITPGGAVSTFASGFGFVWGLAFDQYGNLFAADYYQSTISKITPNGGVSLFTRGVDLPTDLAFDSAGNLFVCNITASQPLGYLSKITPNGTVSTFATGLDYATGVAIMIPEPSVMSLLAGGLFVTVLNVRRKGSAGR
jgi:sugar lactone lactonase YvrE